MPASHHHCPAQPLGRLFLAPRNGPSCCSLLAPKASSFPLVTAKDPAVRKPVYAPSSPPHTTTITASPRPQRPSSQPPGPRSTRADPRALGRGGNAHPVYDSPSPYDPTPFGSDDETLEQYELGDYVEIQARKDRQDREARKRAKRDEKVRRLDELDEMKFSHSIQFNAVPDWSSQYLAYSNLKKLCVLLGLVSRCPQGVTNLGPIWI